MDFLTHGRGTRLITGTELLPPIEEPEPPVLAPMEPEESAAARAAGPSWQPEDAVGGGPRRRVLVGGRP